MTTGQSSLAAEESTSPSPVIDHVRTPVAARVTFRRLAFLAKAAREAWLIFGMTIAIAVIGESAYRIQAMVRRFIAGQPAIEAMHPYQRYSWFPAYLREQETSARLRWRPYAYFRREPYTGNFINVDAQGHRRTVQPVVATDSARPVFLFGGSTMFGSFQRDSFTIASRLAGQLRSLPAGDFTLTNFGESGYVFGQEVIELITQLKNGARPDVVVFYDGINDVVAAVQRGEAGIPQNEMFREADFDLGRTVHSWKTDPLTEARVLMRVFGIVADRSQLLQKLRSFVPLRPHAQRDDDSLARDVVRAYTANVDVVEALARGYGFRVMYVWQSSLHATRKKLTSYEQHLMSDIDSDDFQRRIKRIHKVVPPMLDSAMSTHAPHRFVDQSSLFQDDTLSVYVDEIGHATEQAVPAIANGIWNQLKELLPETAKHSSSISN